MTKITAVVCCWLVLSGCFFNKWVMSEKEINRYYAGKPKPVFFTIEKDSIKLFCATTGSDTLPPLLLIHGAPGAWYGSRNMLDDTMLQKRFHIIAMDRLGYHKSRLNDKKKPVTSIEIQATAIMEAMRLNKSHEKGIVLGSSYGAPLQLKSLYCTLKNFATCFYWQQLLSLIKKSSGGFTSISGVDRYTGCFPGLLKLLPMKIFAC